MSVIIIRKLLYLHLKKIFNHNVFVFCIIKNTIDMLKSIKIIDFMILPILLEKNTYLLKKQYPQFSTLIFSDKINNETLLKQCICRKKYWFCKNLKHGFTISYCIMLGSDICVISSLKF